MKIVDPLLILEKQKKLKKQALASLFIDGVFSICTLLYASTLNHLLLLAIAYNFISALFATSLFISTFYSQRLSEEIARANILIQFAFIFTYFLMFMLYVVG